MLFMCMSPRMPIVRIVSVTCHPASSSASTKGSYFSNFTLGGRDGITILAECEFNELKARVLHIVVCGFLCGGNGADEDVRLEFGKALTWLCGVCQIDNILLNHKIY